EERSLWRDRESFSGCRESREKGLFVPSVVMFRFQRVKKVASSYAAYLSQNFLAYKVAWSGFA
ncbi:MAG: hypothetical protein AABZ59_08790, partial [Candidatus Binatota bacterium]